MKGFDEYARSAIRKNQARSIFQEHLAIDRAIRDDHSGLFSPISWIVGAVYWPIFRTLLSERRRMRALLNENSKRYRAKIAALP